MSEEHKAPEPELEAPSLGQGPPVAAASPPKIVHHLVADDLEVDLAELFEKLFKKEKSDGLHQ